jgi:hypothetical protein
VLSSTFARTAKDRLLGPGGSRTLHGAWRAGIAAAGALVLTATALAAAQPASAATIPINGADVSWPQCPVGNLTTPMPTLSARFMIMGTTAGYAFADNPCLADQVAWAKARHLYVGAYVFTGLPNAAEIAAHKADSNGVFTTSTSRGRLQNAGYGQARQTVRAMRAAKLKVPFVWIDIEPSGKRPWKVTQLSNRSFVEGMIRAYRDLGYGVGFYLSPSSYDDILDIDFKLPEWRTAGPATRSDAIAKCKETAVQGGKIVLAQWWTKTTPRDFDVLCPDFRTEKFVNRYFGAPS